jgi:hypothetical protein
LQWGTPAAAVSMGNSHLEKVLLKSQTPTPDGIKKKKKGCPIFWTALFL